MNEKRIRSVIPMLILLVLIFFLGSWLLRFLQPQGLPYSQVLEQFQEENVRRRPGDDPSRAAEWGV